MKRKIEKINLNNDTELIIRTRDESFLPHYHGRVYYHDYIREILLRSKKQILCIGLCCSNTFTGQKEFIKYTSECILFFKGNSITKTYFIERVFDISSMQSLVLTKEEILERYQIELPENIKEAKSQKRILKQKGK